MGNTLCGKNTYRLNRNRQENRNTVELEQLQAPETVPARDIVMTVPRIIVTDDEKSYVVFDPREAVANEEEKKTIMLLGVKISNPRRFLRQKLVLAKPPDDPGVKTATTRPVMSVARAAFTQSSVILNKMRPGSSPSSSARPPRLRAHSLLSMPSKARNIPYRPSYGESDSQNLSLKPMATLPLPTHSFQHSPTVVTAEVHQISSPPLKSLDSDDSERGPGSRLVAFGSEIKSKQIDQSTSIGSEAGPSWRMTPMPKSIETESEFQAAQPGTSKEGPEEHEAATGRPESGTTSTSDSDENKK